MVENVGQRGLLGNPAESMLFKRIIGIRQPQVLPRATLSEPRTSLRTLAK